MASQPPSDRSQLELRHTNHLLAVEIARREQLEQHLRDRAVTHLNRAAAGFRDLLEYAADLIQAGANDGRYLFVNRAWEETPGDTSREALERNAFDILAPECREPYKLHL